MELYILDNVLQFIHLFSKSNESDTARLWHWIVASHIWITHMMNYVFAT